MQKKSHADPAPPGSKVVVPPPRTRPQRPGTPKQLRQRGACRRWYWRDPERNVRRRAAYAAARRAAAA